MIDSTYSKVDTGKMITADRWIVSLVRDDVHPTSNQHSFIILEGIEDGKIVSERYDLRKNTGKCRSIRIPEDKEEYNQEFAREEERNKVEGETDDPDYTKIFLQGINTEDQNKINNWFEQKVYRHNTEIPKTNSNLRAKTWGISKAQAKKLQQDIIREGVPPRYQGLGDKTISGQSEEGSSSRKGHNCFTWAREKIKNIKINGLDIDVPEDITDYVINLPVVHLNDGTWAGSINSMRHYASTKSGGWCNII